MFVWNSSLGQSSTLWSIGVWSWWVGGILPFSSSDLSFLVTGYNWHIIPWMGFRHLESTLKEFTDFVCAYVKDSSHRQKDPWWGISYCVFLISFLPVISVSRTMLCPLWSLHLGTHELVGKWMYEWIAHDRDCSLPVFQLLQIIYVGLCHILKNFIIHIPNLRIFLNFWKAYL